MTALKTMITGVGIVLLVGLGACTVYVVPAEERGSSAETLVEADEEGASEPDDAEDSSRPAERDMRRRGDAEARDSATAVAESEARAREEAERQARAEAERRAREEAERQARLEAERESAEREARLAAEQANEAAAREARSRARAGTRELHVPPGHHPPEGQCRIWYEDRPPGRQPAATPCEDLLDDDLQAGVFVLYGGESWDGSHDWVAAELEYPGAVPRPVVALSRALEAVLDAGEGSEAEGPSDGAAEQGPPGTSEPAGDGAGRGRSESPRGPR